MNIRKPSDAEIQQIIELSPQAMLEGTLGEVKPTNDKIEQLIDPLLKKGCYYLIAVDEVGFIFELFVKEEFRGKGISKHLITDAIDHLKMEGYSEVRLNVFASNHAIKLYEKMGFTMRNITMKLKL